MNRNKFNRASLIGPRLKAEWTYRIDIVRVCVYACVCVCGPDYLGIRSWDLSKALGMFWAKIRQNIAPPEISEKKYAFLIESGSYGKIQQKCPN